MTSYFQGYVTYEDVRQHKHHPEAYLKAINLSGIKPCKIVVIEDSIPGLISATRASLSCILTLSSSNRFMYEEMSEAKSILEHTLIKPISPLDLSESDVLEAQKNRYSDTNLKENIRH